MRRIASLLLISSLWSCGSDDGGSDRMDPSQVRSVALLPYRLESVQVRAVVTDENGQNEVLTREVSRDEGLIDEKASRIYDSKNDVLILAINDKSTPYNVSLDGTFSRKMKPSVVKDICVVRKEMAASGLASFNKLKLTFTLTARMDGENCPPSSFNEYAGFINSELDALNVHYLNQLRESGIWDLTKTRRLQLKIDVLGTVEKQPATN